MTEDEARSWLEGHDVSRETFALIAAFLSLLREENERQNLIASGTIDTIWSRHVVDSIQLVGHAAEESIWVDLGSGAGFPGMMLAMMRPGRVTMIEQRPLRAAFLERAVETLGLDARVLRGNVRSLDIGPFDAICARAFAPLDRLFESARHLAADGTRWVLPKGKNAKSELEAARASWQGVFRLEPSVTDPEARIVIAEQVRPRSKGLRAR